MKTMSVTEAQKHLSDLVGALTKGPVLLLDKGQPCAALVGLHERFDREAFVLGRNKRLRQLMDDACRGTAATGGIQFSDILAEVQGPAARRRSRRKSPPARS